MAGASADYLREREITPGEAWRKHDRAGAHDRGHRARDCVGGFDPELDDVVRPRISYGRGGDQTPPEARAVGSPEPHLVASRVKPVLVTLGRSAMRLAGTPSDYVHGSTTPETTAHCGGTTAPSPTVAAGEDDGSGRDPGPVSDRHASLVVANDGDFQSCEAVQICAPLLMLTWLPIFDTARRRG